LLWLEVLKREQKGQGKKSECHQAAEITAAVVATTAAAGTPRLQVWIFKFGQRRLPVV
jgi:hypothetical protein